MKQQRRTVIFWILFVLLVGSTGSLLWAGGTKEDVDISVAAYKGPSGFGIVKLLEDQPDLGDGVTASYTVLPTPQEMVGRVASGEVDIAVFPVNLAAKLYSKGPGYVLGAVTGEGLIYALSSNHNIGSWQDLQGATVHSVGKGATPELLTRFFLNQNSLDPDQDVTLDFSYNAAPQLVQMAAAGNVETVILPEPFATLVQKKAPDFRVVLDYQKEWADGAGNGSNYPITVVVISPELIEKRPDAVNAFLDAYGDSIDWVNNNHQEAAQLIEKHGIFTAAMALPAIPGCNLKFIPADDAQTMVEDFLKVLLEANPASIGGALPDEGFYYQR